MIYVDCGDIGSGKTHWAMSQLEQAVRARRPVYTNIELLPACPYADDVCRIGTDEWPVVKGEPGQPGYSAFWRWCLPGSLIIIDEADLWFDCTDHGKFPAEVREYCKLSRKLGQDLIFIVQNCENLYVRIRRLASRHIVCEWTYRTRRIFGVIEDWCGRPTALRFSKFLRSEFSSPTFNDSSHRGDGMMTYREASRFFGWYRTDQLLGNVDFFQWHQFVDEGGADSREARELLEAAQAEASRRDESERRAVRVRGRAQVGGGL